MRQREDWWEYTKRIIRSYPALERKQIAGDQCSKCGFQHYGTSINHYKFCPACGAPMTDEAVEMVMERMEKLHENIHND